MLSRNYTVATLFAEAIRDAGHLIGELDFERIHIVNRAVAGVANNLYALMINDYMTEAVVSPAGESIYPLANTGTWVLETMTLSHPELNRDFTDVHKGRMIIFRVGTTVAVGFIASVVSTDTVVLTGDISVGDGSVITLLSPENRLVEDEISLSTIGLKRVGTQVRLALHSTVATGGICDPMMYEELSVWDPTSRKNTDRIAYAYLGSKLKLKRASNLADYGTMRLIYPRVPVLATGQTEKIDLPDGAPIEIAILKCRLILSRRYPTVVQVDDPREEMMRLVQSVYSMAGATAEFEEIKQKVEALL